MSVLVIFLSATSATLGVAALLGRRRLRDAAPAALRVGLAVMFLVTGLSHFAGLREDLVAMVPPGLPRPELLVTVTGVLELAGAVGLLVPRTAAWAAGGLGLLMVLMFPANVHAATAGLTLGGEPATALLPRAAMQLLYVASAAVVVVTHWRRAVLSDALGQFIAVLPRAHGPAAEPPDASATDVVLVSRLRLRSARHVPGFLLVSLRLRRAVRRAPGAVWLELAAQPLTGTFWTWSRWTDEDAMRRYTRSELHAHVMRSYRPRLRESAFRPLPAAQAPTTWPEVREVLRTTTRTVSGR
ncbi:DoxX family protein [Kocuria sediminis]|uniref:DoxX family protein n=1 Tax=Kocuria sediminis TaxID=1038857 RepID=UPI00197D52ED|nr:DoxX family protein [Kocuria sediminis]